MLLLFPFELPKKIGCITGFMQPKKSNRDSEVKSEKDRWAKTNSDSAALLMIQNKHLTKANIIDWSYIYGADKIFI